MVDLAMSIFEFLTKFLVFWHPWHPWVCIRSDLKQIWAIPPTVQYVIGWANNSDESEPSWLEPELELKDFQLGSARLGSWPFSLQLEIENRPKTSRNFDFDFLIFLIFVYVAKS